MTRKAKKAGRFALLLSLLLCLSACSTAPQEPPARLAPDHTYDPDNQTDQSRGNGGIKDQLTQRAGNQPCGEADGRAVYRINPPGKNMFGKLL